MNFSFENQELIEALDKIIVSYSTLSKTTTMVMKEDTNTNKLLETS
jgi:hypothetical protein